MQIEFGSYEYQGEFTVQHRGKSKVSINHTSYLWILFTLYQIISINTTWPTETLDPGSVSVLAQSNLCFKLTG